MIIDKISLQSLFNFSDICAGQEGNIITNCRLDSEFLQSALIPFHLITGGLLTLIFWGTISLAVYLKYHNFIMAAVTGVPVLIVGVIALPQQAYMYVSILMILGVACTIFIILWRVPRD